MRFGLRLLLLTALGVGCSGREAPAESAEPETREDRPAPEAGEPAAELETALDVPEVVARVLTLEEQVQALRDLLEGHLPRDVSPAQLFEVALDDEAAVARRVEALENTLLMAVPHAALHDAGLPDAALPDGALRDGGPWDGDLPDGARLEGLLDGAIDDGGTPDAGMPDAGAPDAGVRDAGVPPMLPDGALADAGPPSDAGPPTDAGPADAGVDAGAEETAESLERQRDRLRLRFLRLSAADREGILQSVEHAHRLDLRAAEAAAEAEAAENEQRLAEEAAARAEEEQRNARDSVARLEANAELAAQRARVQLAELLTESAQRRRAEVEEEREQLAIVHRARAALLADLGADDAAQQYDLLVDALVTTRRELGEALGRPHATLPDRPSSAPETPWREAQERLETQRRERIDALATAVHEGNELRLRLLPYLPPAKRHALTGFGAEGRAQLLRELDQVQLMARYGTGELLHDAPQLPSRTFAAIADPAQRRTSLTLFAILAVAIAGWRRREGWLATLEARAFARVHDRPRLEAALRPWWRRVEVLAPWLWACAGVYLATEQLHALIETPAWAIARDLLMTLFAYRALVAFLRDELTAARESRRTYIDTQSTAEERRAAAQAAEKRAQAVARDVRLVGRTALLVALSLGITVRVVGRGTLFSYASTLAIVVVVLVALVLLRRWESSIVVAHRDHFPDAFAKRLEGSKGLTRRVLVVGALLRVAGHSTKEFAKDLSSRFGAGRKALVLLARRRAEEAEQAGRTPQPIPEALRERLPIGALDGEDVDGPLPDLDEVIALFEEPGFSVALVGEQGAGKSTWLNAIAAKVERAKRIDAIHGCDDPRRLCMWLGEQLVGEPKEDLESLLEALREAPPMVVLLDQAQNLFLRRVGGTESVATLFDLMARSEDQIDWVVAFSEHAWLYLQSGYAGQTPFRRVVQLGRWSDTQLAQMLESRTRRAGFEVSYEGLLDGEPAGTARDRALARSRSEFFRLLADYCEGNPRLATWYWRRLVEVVDGEARVRAFHGPEAHKLDDLHDDARFALGALALHVDLSPAELGEVLRMNPSRSAAILDVLRRRQLVERLEQGSYRITVHWFRAVVRHLRRRRMLFS